MSPEIKPNIITADGNANNQAQYPTTEISRDEFDPIVIAENQSKKGNRLLDDPNLIRNTSMAQGNVNPARRTMSQLGQYHSTNDLINQAQIIQGYGNESLTYSIGRGATLAFNGQGNLLD